MGPVLIFVALIILGWIKLPVEFGGVGQSSGDRLAKWGLLGEFLLGGLIALSFYPIKAALFFGALLLMILVGSFPALSPVALGFGIALPLGVLAIAIAIGAKSSIRLLAAIQSSQGLLRTATATVILFFGIYLVCTLSFGLAN